MNIYSGKLHSRLLDFISVSDSTECKYYLSIENKCKKHRQNPPQVAQEKYFKMLYKNYEGND